MVCDEETDVAYISREDFEMCIGGSFNSIIQRNSLVGGLANTSLFGQSAKGIHAIADICKIVEFQDRSVLCS